MKHGIPFGALALMLLMLFSGEAARAHEAHSGDITLEHPWARPAAKGQNGAVYVRIVNAGATADRLIAVRTALAERAELHKSTMTDGIHRMRPVEAIEVPAGGDATLAPGGYHIMLVKLGATFLLEERLPIVFVFENAGEIATTFAVEQRAGTDHHGGHGDMSEHDMGGAHEHDMGGAHEHDMGGAHE